MGRRAVSPSGAVPLFLRRKDSATLPVCDRRVSYSAPHGQTAPPVTPKMEATANFACRRCTTACLLWPAGTTNQLHRVFLHHTVSEADSLGLRRQEARPILFVNRSDVPGCRWFLVPFSYFHRADLLQRPRQTCAKCCNQGCGTHRPPHLRNGAPLLNSGAFFWAPPCSRQRKMSLYGTYALRNRLDKEFGVSSLPSPGYFEAALGVVGWLTSLYFGKAGAALRNSDQGRFALMAIYYSKSEKSYWLNCGQAKLPLCSYYKIGKK